MVKFGTSSKAAKFTFEKTKSKERILTDALASWIITYFKVYLRTLYWNSLPTTGISIKNKSYLLIPNGGFSRSNNTMKLKPTFHLKTSWQIFARVVQTQPNTAYNGVHILW